MSCHGNVTEALTNSWGGRERGQTLWHERHEKSPWATL